MTLHSILPHVVGLVVLVAEPTEAEKWANLRRMMTPTAEELAYRRAEDRRIAANRQRVAGREIAR